MDLIKALEICICGAALGVSGTVCRAIYGGRASPESAGISPGASFGAVAAALAGLGAAPILLSSAAFGLFACFFNIFWTGGRFTQNRKRHTSQDPATGVFFVFASLLILSVNEPASPDKLLYGVIQKTPIWGMCVMSTAVLLVFLLRWKIGLLALSRDESAVAGISQKGLYITLIACAIAAVSVCAVSRGLVLILPRAAAHMGASVSKGRFRFEIPAAMVSGAIMLLLSEFVAAALGVPQGVIFPLIGVLALALTRGGDKTGYIRP